MNTNFRAIYGRHLEKQALVNVVMKAARCWAGYEPVPGKAPYSEDSCRPKGSKKKPKAKKPAEKQAENPAENPVAGGSQPPKLYSETPFNPAHAITTMGLKPNTPAHLAYNRMMSMYRNKKFTPAQFSAFNDLYGNLPPRFSALSAPIVAEPGHHGQPATAPPVPPPPPPPAPTAPAPTARPALQPVGLKTSASEACGGVTASTLVRDATQPTPQIKPKAVGPTHSKQVLTRDSQQKPPA